MGTHPIFESDFDCLTDFLRHGTRKYLVRAQGQEHQRPRFPTVPNHWLPIWSHPKVRPQRLSTSIPRNRTYGWLPEARLNSVASKKSHYPDAAVSCKINSIR